MANVYATVEDVDLTWTGTISVSEKPRVQRLLDDAHAILRSKVASIDTAAADGNVNTDLVRMMLVAAVTRVLDNPKGILGGGTGETNFYYGQTGSGRYGTLYLDDDDLALLGLGSKRSVGIATFRMSSPFAVIHDQPWRE